MNSFRGFSGIIYCYVTTNSFLTRTPVNHPVFLLDFNSNLYFLLTISKNSKSSFSQFCERPKIGLRIHRIPAKILALLKAADMMSPYYLSVINSYTCCLLADANVFKAFSYTMLKVDNSEFHRCFVFYQYLLCHYNLIHYTYMTS